MEYVYLMTNKFVPELVKFGFSARDPHDRAAELSSPTGVPGRWTVHHYWEVEDGYAVEQAVFRSLSARRLDKQEFLRFTADEAVRVIGKEIGRIGTNPIEKARKKAEAEERARQAEAERWAAQREIIAVKRREFENRRDNVIEQIETAQKPIRAAMDRSDSVTFKLVTIAVFLIGFFANQDAGIIGAIIKGIAWVVVGYLFVIIPLLVGLIQKNSKYREQLEEAESRVLRLHGLKSRDELKIPKHLDTKS